MSTTSHPLSLDELTEAVRSLPQLLAVGAETKPRLSAVNVAKLSTTGLRGIIEYEPSEFTFTALAGTPLRDIIETLAVQGQYLPFDPLWVEAGATLGGTVASGLNGPGRFRFGGLRDFILGVRFVDGGGRLLRMGGKVVKNAAGFDLPKFFVGSLGRFGVLGEITCKVFPRPLSTLTLKIPVEDMETAARIFIEASKARWEVEALDLLPGGQAVCLRLSGPPEALEEIAREILSRWPGEILPKEEAQTIWSELREVCWAHSQGLLMKVVLTPMALPALVEAFRAFEDVRFHVSVGGNQALLSLPPGTDVALLEKKFCALGLPAMTLRGNAPLWYGLSARPAIFQAVKKALDPEGRFPSLDD